MKAYGHYDRLYQNYIDLFAWMEKEGWKVADAQEHGCLDYDSIEVHMSFLLWMKRHAATTSIGPRPL